MSDSPHYPHGPDGSLSSGAPTTSVPSNVAPHGQHDDYWGASDAVSGAARSAASTWLRLQNDGDSAVVCLAQRPYSYLAHVTADPATRRPRKLRCVDARTCERCRRGDKPRALHLLDVIVVGDASRRVYEASDMTYRALRVAAQDYPPDRTAYRLVRNGRAGDNRTTYAVVPAGVIPELAREVLATTQAPDLEALSWRDSASDTSADAARRGTDQDLPF